MIYRHSRLNRITSRTAGSTTRQASNEYLKESLRNRFTSRYLVTTSGILLKRKMRTIRHARLYRNPRMMTGIWYGTRTLENFISTAALLARNAEPGAINKLLLPDAAAILPLRGHFLAKTRKRMLL